jgi:hypothetical protein
VKREEVQNLDVEAQTRHADHDWDQQQPPPGTTQPDHCTRTVPEQPAVGQDLSEP